MVQGSKGNIGIFSLDHCFKCFLNGDNGYLSLQIFNLQSVVKGRTEQRWNEFTLSTFPPSTSQSEQESERHSNGAVSL